MPSVAEQERGALQISAAFARAGRLEAEAARALKLLARLEAAILAKAFRGELVPQNPDDEPASVLLDRIRAERATYRDQGATDEGWPAIPGLNRHPANGPES